MSELSGRFPRKFVPHLPKLSRGEMWLSKIYSRGNKYGKSERQTPQPFCLLQSLRPFFKDLGQVGPFELGPGEIGLDQVGSLEPSPTEVGSAQIGAR